MAEGVQRPVRRRTLLGAALLTLAGPTCGCGIRLEDGAPRLPLVPTRTPLPAEASLVVLTRATAALAERAAALEGALAADLATLHRRQHTVLRTTLVRRQVPVDHLDTPARSATTATTTATAAPTASPSTAPAPRASSDGPAGLAQAEASAAAAAGSFAGVSPDLRATVAALHAQRYAAATLLSGRAPTVPREPVGGDAALELAAATTAAIWLLEVVSARSEGAQRQRSDATLDALRRLLADQVAGGSRPDASIGHPLPFPVSTPAAAARLAREVLTTLRASCGEHLEPLATEHGADGMDAVTRWVGTVEVEAHRWGLALAPFPGLA